MASSRRPQIEPIGHCNFKTAFDELFGLASFPGVISIIALVGPPGAGKSRALIELEEALSGPATGDNVVQMFCPFLYTECVTQGGGQFLWFDWYIRSLRKLNEPFIDRKRRPTPEEALYLAENDLPRSLTKKDAALRLALENALSRRRVEWLVADEAHALTHVNSAKLYLGQLESLKSLANTSGAMIILAGTYELLELLGLNSQLRRRTHIIHLAPYYGDSVPDMEAFKSAIMSLIKALDIKLAMNIEELIVFIFDNTQGCVGAAHDILARAKSVASVTNKGVITEAILKRFKLSVADKTTLIGDIRVGREKIEEIRIDDGSAGKAKAEKQVNPKDSKKKGPQRKPGRRKPTMDPVLPKVEPKSIAK